MSAESLQRIFKFGNILALTPSYSTPKETLRRKFYALVIVTSIAVGVVISVNNRNFYKGYIYMKIFVNILLDLNLLIFNCYTTLEVVFFKKHQWQKLMKNLKIVVARINSSDDSTATVFFMTQVVGVMVIIAYLYIWLELRGMNHLQLYNVQYFQIYLLYTYTVLLCLIVNLFLSSYRRLNYFLEQIIERGLGKNLLLMLKKVEISVCHLRDSIDIFNEIFSWPIALIISYTTLYILNDSYSIFLRSSYAEDHKNLVMKVTSSILFVLLSFLGTTSLIIMCDSVLEEAGKIRSNSHRLRRSCSNVTPREREEIREFCVTIKESFPRFSAARFFTIKRSTILNILGTITSFLIIMIQFYISLE
ncbi:7tm 7 domain containing protein [Asbolus verrucosus]|uniref:Gustatory receptor n=1 Tax=Asbolus verrucosus TaxID=1661398 RepID=A0A482VYQ6_ASBVE|nr:7tm 7 domain containing protein [Asbolus verrucosus]